MAEEKYDDVSVLVFDPDLTSRKGTAFALNNLGIRRVDEHYSLRELREGLTSNDYEMLFLECNEQLTGTFEVVRDLRRNRLGRNPFVSVMLTLWTPTQDIVVRSLRSGADDIIVKPFSTNTVSERVMYQIARRKPFVFDDRYTGPVRRVSKEELRAMAPVEVPNNLRAKARSEPVTVINQELIDSIFSFQRCKEQQARIDEAVGGLQVYFETPEAGDFPIGLVANLISASSELAEKARTGKFFHIVELCSALNDVARNMQQTGVSTNIKEIALLDNIAAAIATGLRDRESAAEAAHEIASTVRRSHKNTRK